ncbi:Cell number regulator 10 [Hordeum vulgare]|nr:Cell number regulator 10 [Hordeum vulgare]
MEAGTTPWSTGLFDCAEDHGVCLLGWCCPCIVVGRVAEILDKGATSSGSAACLYVVIGVLTAWECQWIYSCVNRTKMRAQYGLQENPCPDCCVHFWLESCAICQEYRELRNRGFVMDIGWEANLELQKQQGRVEGSTVPPAMQHMI